MTKKGDMDVLKKLDNYFFYLSFEHSICDDYITDEFTNMLKHNIVPVVMGAPKRYYEKIAPPKSFIHVNDFKHPEHLAKYLIYLQNNPGDLNFINSKVRFLCIFNKEINNEGKFLIKRY